MRHHLNKTNFPKSQSDVSHLLSQKHADAVALGFLPRQQAWISQVPGHSYCQRGVFFCWCWFFFFFSLSLPGTFLDLENTTSHMPYLQVQLTYAMLKYFLKEFFSCSFKFFEEQSSDLLSFRYYGFPKLRNRGPIQIHFQVIFFLLAKLLRYLLVELAEPAIPESFHSHKVRLPDQGLLQRKFTDLLEVLTHLCFTFSKKRHFT